mgnify:CR=1 FL=1
MSAQVVSVKINGGFDMAELWKLGILMVIYMFVVGYSFPWLTRRVFGHNNDPITQYIFILALVFVASLLAKIIGLEAILGAFYAGLVLNPMIPGRSGLMKNIKFVGNAIFIPYFLIGVGMPTTCRAYSPGTSSSWLSSSAVIRILICFPARSVITVETMQQIRIMTTAPFMISSVSRPY